jgi:hypothetical protein
MERIEVEPLDLWRHGLSASQAAFGHKGRGRCGSRKCNPRQNERRRRLHNAKKSDSGTQDFGAFQKLPASAFEN